MTIYGGIFKHHGLKYSMLLLLLQRWREITGPLPGFRNWVPEIGNLKILGRPIFQGRPQYTQITTINMYPFNEIGIMCIYNAINIKLR